MYNGVKITLKRWIEDENKRRFVIYPFGAVGRQVKKILNEEYGIKELFVADDLLKSKDIYDKNYIVANGIPEDCYVIIATLREDIYAEKYGFLIKYINAERILSIFNVNVAEYGLQYRILQRRGFDFENCIYEMTGGIKYYMPYWNTDYIQKYISLNDRFYEDKYLDFVVHKFSDRIKGKNVLDIGANAGNHSMYLVLFGAVHSVLAFEPIPETYEILQRNICLNNLDDRIKPQRIAIGDKNGKGRRNFYDIRNIGATPIHEDSEGEFDIKVIDEMEFDEQIGLIKIDVEGFEEKVIRGAVKTIKKYKPILMVEIFDEDEHFWTIEEIMRELGYKIEVFDEGNYIFY